MSLTNRLLTVGLAAVSVMASGGCSEEYLLRADHLAMARNEIAAGAPPERLVVAAKDSTSRETLLRYSRLPELPLVSGDQTVVKVRSKDSRAQRIAGTTLFTIGLAHLVALAGHGLGFLASARSCSATPGCINEDFSLLISGPVLGSIGLSLLVPGIALMSTGYGSPRDAQPGRSDLIYIK